jgi:hypothetical protein
MGYNVFYIPIFGFIEFKELFVILDFFIALFVDIHKILEQKNISDLIICAFVFLFFSLLYFIRVILRDHVFYGFDSVASDTENLIS